MEKDNSNVPEYDPSTMTIQERSDWVDQNVEKTFYTPIRSLRSEWLYTNLHTDSVWTAWYSVGKLETQVKYLADGTRVSDTSTVVFRATPLQPPYPTPYTESGRNWINQGNVRVWYSATFSDQTGTHLLEHWYNFYANGNYALQVIY